MSICLLVGGSADYTQAALSTWQAALALWQLEWTTCEPGQLVGLRPNSTPVVVVDGFGPQAEIPWSELSDYVRRGGHVLLTGQPGLEAAWQRAQFQKLTGVAAVMPGQADMGYPALRVDRDVPALAPWRTGEVLFFTNPGFDEQNRNSWGRIAQLGTPAPEVLATTYWTALLPEPKSERFAGQPSDEPGLVAYRPYAGGGQVIYTPLPLGLIQQIMTPEVVEVDSRPGLAVNHGLYLLIKSLLVYLLQDNVSPVAWLDLWPGGAAGVVCLTGDVHEFHGSPSGMAREEFRYITPVAEMLNRRGLTGKFTFYVTGLLAQKHAEALRDAQTWEFGGHTFSDTGYVDEVPPGHNANGSAEAPDLTVGRAAQAQDIAQTLAALTLPDRAAWRSNWRTHYYASTAVSREVLAEQGVQFLSDMGLYWPGEWQPERFGQPLISFVTWPQRARGASGQLLDLWEMGEGVPSDYAVWVSGARHPELPWARVLTADEAYAMWTQRVERAWRCGELLVINWHPYHTRQAPERIAALERTLDYACQLPGLRFMTMAEAGQWWAARSRITLRTLAAHRDALVIGLENPTDAALADLSLRLWLPVGMEVERLEAPGSLSASHHLTGERDVCVRLNLPARSQVELTVWVRARSAVVA